MNATKLAKTLSNMYHTAEEGEAATMVHLFGIRYCEQLQACGKTPHAIAQLARISYTYGTEIYKGIKLARYVEEK